jgi:hypothetical protein
MTLVVAGSHVIDHPLAVAGSHVIDHLLVVAGSHVTDHLLVVAPMGRSTLLKCLNVFVKVCI